MKNSTLYDHDVLALTKDGERELREAGTKLTQRQLEVLVLIDTPVHPNVAQLTARARNLAPNDLRTCLEQLIASKLVSIVAADSSTNVIDTGLFFTFKTAPTSTAEAGEQNTAQADADAELLRRKGYCVNMARCPVKRIHPERRTLMVLIIDDDPDICRVLKMYLELEGFETRVATNRDEIVAALRHPMLPDLVLLDVMLGTDLNGFDILAKMRQHPVLKELPVIMLTAEATRAAVLRGILGGAEGYITKPFEIHPLVKAVKTVLGMKVDAKDTGWDHSL